MTLADSVFESYVPGLVRARFLGDGTPARARGEVLPVCLLFADVSGFTPLVEQLSQHEHGPEEVQRILDRCFGALADVVEAYGGEVLKFAGDAVLGLWTATDEDAALRAAVERAVACTSAARARVDGADVGGGLRLRLRFALGAGRVLAASVGGVENRWELLLTGEPLRQIGVALGQAAPGEVVASSAAAALLPPRQVVTPCPGGVRIALGEVVPPPAHAGSPTSRPSDEALRAYVPRALQARLEAGQTEWLGEFRRVSVLFVNLRGLEAARDDDLAPLQNAVHALQTAVYHYGGSINNVVADDKGTIALAGWGLALHSHEDDAVRAVLAALAIRRELTAQGLDPRIGIATARIYIGPRGNAHRREYALIGDGVNLASRLMQAAEPVLCDAATRTAARRRIVFESLPPLTVKGKAQRLEVYRPSAALGVSARARTGVVGREAEKQRIDQRIVELERAGRGGVFLLEGEAGIGKSKLVEYLLGKAQTAAVRTLVGSADAIERSTAYHAWRPVLASLLGLEAVNEPAAERERLETLLGADARLRDWAPLLNPLLHFPLPETATTAAMAGESRANGARELLVQVFREATGGVPTLLVLEDAHWLDSASWDLAAALGDAVPSALMVLVSRPLTDDVPASCKRLVESAERLKLSSLSPGEALALVCQRLDADSVPDALGRFIHERAGGHPFFTEELAYSLRDRGLLRVEGGECRLTTGDAELDSFDLPETVQGVVTARIDGLTPQQQLTLKLAAVLGQRFEVAALRHTHPITADRESIAEQLETMMRLDLIERADAEGGACNFKHAIIRDIAYSLLLYAQRQQLHGSVAEWYEKTLGAGVAGSYALLAHHWLRDTDMAKAIEYLEKAGEHALSGSYANREAAGFFGELLRLAEQMEEPGGADVAVPGHQRRLRPTEIRRARWERLLGEALMNQGRHVEGCPHMERSLARLDEPLPAAGRPLLRALLRRVRRQLVRRVLGGRPGAMAPESRRVLLDVASAYARLGAAYQTLARDLPLRMYLLISALEVSERAGPSPELASSYANMVNVTGWLGLHRLARVYMRLARETAATVDHPPTTAFVLGRTSVYRYCLADWSAAEDVARSLEISDRIGNNYQWEETTSLHLRCTAEQDPEQGVEIAREMQRRARLSGALTHQLWALSGLADCLRRLGRFDEAIECAEEMLSLLSGSTVDPNSFIEAHGILACAWTRRGELDRADGAAAEAARVLATTSSATYQYLGRDGLAETWFALWERGGEAAAEPSKRLGGACKAFLAYAKHNPVSRPTALRWQGLLEWQHGRAARAGRVWAEGLQTAERMKLPYTVAQLRYEIGRHREAHDPERSRQLETAADTFERLGAHWDAARTRSLREKG